MNAKRRAPAHGAGREEERSLAWPGDPESLAAESVDFEALALVLANTCRRDGRLRRFHSLAAHGVAMSEAIEDLGGDVREASLHALLFEASVAWLGPDAAPTRRPTDKLRRLGARVDRAVREAAGLDPEPPAEADELVRFIARMAESAEVRDLPGASAAPAVYFPPLNRRIRPIDPARAARLWIERLHDLKGSPGAEGSAETNHADESGERNEEKPHVTYARTTQEEASPATGGSRDAA